ncbi:MAG: acylphosphatase [Methylovirgula sp.]
MESEETIVRVRVCGRVQGVGYRVFTQTEAMARGITGWVRNRSNGDVEAVFAGRIEAVDALCEICRQGPPLAFVEALEISIADDSALKETGWDGGFLQLATF